MISLRDILLPVDFSEPSLRATEYGLEIARRFGATLHLLHVIEDPVIYLPMFESYPVPTSQQFETYAQDRLENWILPEDADQCSIETLWVHGRPASKIVEYATDCRSDLIILGTHGRGSAVHLLLGSVAEKVVRKAPCPVLTVHASGKTFLQQS